MNRRDTVAIEGGDMNRNKSKHRSAAEAQTESNVQNEERRGAKSH